MLTALGWILAAVYAAFLVFCFRGARALRRARPVEPAGRPSVTVVVPLRNEEHHAAETLAALAQQDYTGEWHVVCVDDRSTDRTPAILAAFCAMNPRFTWFSIHLDAPAVPSPKKRALAEGFSRARGEVLMTTDADCLPPPGWLRALAEAFAPAVGIVQGPKRIRAAGGLLQRYQEVEVFGLVSIEAASFALGRPLLASAPSLAYRRELYQAVGGFAGIEDSVSGDDDLLVRKMLRRGGFTVRYVPDVQACVTTGPAPSWPAMLQQRARWASNGTRYPEKGFVAALGGLYLFYAWLFFAPLGAALGCIPWSSVALLWILKIGLNGIFLAQTAPILGLRGLGRDLVWCEILHVPIVLLAVPMGRFGWYRWR